MAITELIYNGDKYYYITTYKFSFGVVHKFSGISRNLFYQEVNGNLELITEENKIKEILDFTQVSADIIM